MAELYLLHQPHYTEGSLARSPFCFGRQPGPLQHAAQPGTMSEAEFSSRPFYLTYSGAFHAEVSDEELVMNVIHEMEQSGRLCGGRGQCVGRVDDR